MECTSLAPNIGVKNVNETVKFYTEQLGFRLITSNPESGNLLWAMVGSGNVAMMFQENNSLAEEYPELAGKSAGLLTFYVKVKGLEALYNQLKDTGMIVKPLGRTFYGANEFAIRDNNGYVLTITEDD